DTDEAEPAKVEEVIEVVTAAKLMTEVVTTAATPITAAQMILLVEKKYPLIRFTLEQMLNNVRLEFKEESEMSLEFLRKYAKGLLLLVEDLMPLDKVVSVVQIVSAASIVVNTVSSKLVLLVSAA
nr:hypothetical protein [Tanacetum cinerariifolium]